MVSTKITLKLLGIVSKLLRLRVALLLFWVPFGSAESLRVCYENQSYPPFLLGVETTPQDNPGILLELIQMAAAEVSVDVQFYRRPWKRCIADLEYGKSDALFAAIWKADREKWAVFPKADGRVDSSRSLWHVQYPIFVKRGTALTFDGVIFAGIQFGLSAPIGYVANDKLSEMAALAPGSHDIENGLKLVSLGRMDGYVVETYIGRSTVSTLGLNDSITVLPVPFLEADWFLPVSHNYYQQHQETAEALWSALARVRRDSANALMDKYAVAP